MRWYKAIIGSLLINILLWCGAGWLLLHGTGTPELQYEAVEVVLAPDEAYDPANMPADPAVQGDMAVSDGQSIVPGVPQEPDSRADMQTMAETDAQVPPVQERPGSSDVPGRLLSGYSKEQLDVVQAQFDQALQLNSSLSTVYGNRGEILYDKGEFDQALADFDKAISMNPRFAQAYTGRGFIYSKRGQWELALADFNKAVELAPREPLAYYGRALCFSAQGDTQKAVSDWQTFLKYSDNNGPLEQKAKRFIAEQKK